ncbi:helix-turn-helix domain-containing protein [Rhizobium leguminosarum]|uniref:helix-turn-helix domain-containing protein n=1 Tax=Rhizobium TaxID=379 RepID=UPI001C950713|nr:helix-turn-helix domain-containing protein [Rhizobium leguminosarum]MBY5388950.1 helix-turn-helix domain-containing protein [Rhizobium leguminosarum]
MVIQPKRKRPSNRAMQEALIVLGKALSDKLGVPISHGLGTDSSPTLVPAAKAADYLGVSQKTLANWRCSGTRGLLYVQVGSRILYRQNDLDDFILNSRKSSTSEKLAGRNA